MHTVYHPAGRVALFLRLLKLFFLRTDLLPANLDHQSLTSPGLPLQGGHSHFLYPFISLRLPSLYPFDCMGHHLSTCLSAHLTPQFFCGTSLADAIPEWRHLPIHLPSMNFPYLLQNRRLSHIRQICVLLLTVVNLNEPTVLLGRTDGHL